jgi:hypothetical protein
MFRWYGGLGLAMVILAQANFIFRVQPFALWYFPIIWFGYILLVDAVVLSLRGSSLIHDRPRVFAVMLGLSAAVWWAFELIGFVLGNWYYSGTEGFASFAEKMSFATISFSTVIPAVFETTMLLRAVHLFDHAMLKSRHGISKNLLHGMMALGIVSFALPMLYPGLFYPIIWVSFFLILDPVNYMHRRPSIISHIRDRRLAIPLSIFVGATITGFLWEFWNFWAIPKWHYSLPYVDFLKVFEMPALGYLGYGPFGLELFAMYHFFMWLIHEGKGRVFLLSMVHRAGEGLDSRRAEGSS